MNSSRLLWPIAALAAMTTFACQQPTQVDDSSGRVASDAQDPQASPTPGAETVPADSDPALAAEAHELLHGPPDQWTARFGAVVAKGAPMAQALAAEVAKAARAVPPPRGLHVAVGALEALGRPEAAHTLRAIASSDGPAAADSALALGALPDDPATDALLRGLAGDRSKPEGIRAAAAASLLRLGRGETVRDLLQALLLAGTPAGKTLGEEHGLPNKQRWALERHYLLRAMRMRAGDTFGLDTDAPWPKLEQGTKDFLAWLDAQGTGGGGR